jgi:hypothetical protein
MTIENLGLIAKMLLASFCLLIGLKNPGILGTVTKLHNKRVNGQKCGVSGGGAVTE